MDVAPFVLCVFFFEIVWCILSSKKFLYLPPFGGSGIYDTDFF